MRNGNAARLLLVLAGVFCFSGGYLLWGPAPAEAQGAGNPGVSGRVSALEHRLAEAEARIDTLMLSLAALHANLEACCGSGDCGDDNGSGPGGDECTGPLVTWYLDADGDGYGDPNNSIEVCEGVTPAGYVLNSDDCDDGDASINPGNGTCE